jgi:hypothetical protein
MRPCTPIIIPTPLHIFGVVHLYTAAKYKHRNLEVVTTDSKNGRWEVEVTVSWLAHRVEERMKFGPYQGFVSAPDAQSWGIIRSIEWINSGNSEPSAFIPLTVSLEQNLPAVRVVNRR